MASKRPARATPETPSKRQAKDTSKDKCSSVLSVVTNAEGFSESVRRMLNSMASVALNTPSAERHAFQAAIIDMVGEVMTTVETQAEETVKELEGKVSNVPTDKTNRQDALVAAQQNLVTLKDDAIKRQEELQSAHEALAAAKKALTAAEKAQASGDVNLVDATGRQKKLQDAKTKLLEPIKGRTAETPEVKALVALGKQYSFDPSMLQALPSVLKKDPSDRAGFDVVTLEQLDQEISKALAEQTAIVDEGEPAKRQRAEAVEAAKAALEAAHAQIGAAKEALGEAQIAEQEGEDTLVAAKNAVANFFLDTKALMDQYDSKQAWLEELRTGPLVAFKALNPPKPEAVAA